MSKKNEIKPLKQPDVISSVFGSYRKRSGKRYMQNFIESDGKKFIRIYYDDDDGGFEFEFTESMTKEFFAAFKKHCL